MTHKQYLIPLGVMEQIKRNYSKFREYEKLLIEIVGNEHEDHIMDEIYGNDTFDMDVILDKCNIIVEKDG